MTVGFVAATRAADEAAGTRRDDRHGVGVAEGVAAVAVPDGAFEHGEHQPGGTGDARSEGWEAVFARVLGRLCLPRPRVVVTAEDGDRDLRAGLTPGHLGVNAVAGRVSEDLEAFGLPAVVAVEPLRAAALFDGRAKEVVDARPDRHFSDQLDIAQLGEAFRAEDEGF